MMNGSGGTESDPAQLRLEGLNLIARLRSGEATDHDAAAFVTWRSTSRAHEDAFRAAVRLTETVRLAELADEDHSQQILPHNVLSIGTVTPRNPARRLFLGGAIAASFVGGGLFLGRSLEILPTFGEALAEYRTGPGERRRIVLQGGAIAELNTRTSANGHDGLGMPGLELVNGEAILTSGASGRAALVAGAGASVVSAGRLNARTEGDAVCITCLEGRVVVAWADQQRSLMPSDEVRYTPGGIGAVKRGIDQAVVTAWQSGTLIFHNLPMKAVVAEINRYRAGKVYLANGKLGGRPLSGTYYIDRLDDFFNQAELALGVTVTRLPGDIVILS